LIIATADGNRKDIVEQLQRLGLTVYVVNPSNTERILNGIIRIGEITGKNRKQLCWFRNSKRNRKGLIS